MEYDPPLLEAFNSLLQKNKQNGDDDEKNNLTDDVQECQLPVIDLSDLNSLNEEIKENCKKAIIEASSSWGFFQVINHGIPKQDLEKMHCEQIKFFRLPFTEKSQPGFFNFPEPSYYRWGNPLATSLSQFSWCEAFQINLSNILLIDGCYTSLRSSIEDVAAKMENLAKKLAELLAEELGVESKSCFEEKFSSSDNCYLRLNRYPQCTIPSEVFFGFLPHTDSDFLTVLYQDQVGGLQLINNGKWFRVKPIPDALIINIGDFFEAWSNGIYKSVKHRVVSNRENERFSMAYFYRPNADTIIESCIQPSIYRKFTFKEYMQQIHHEVEAIGEKIGLPNFLLN